MATETSVVIVDPLGGLILDPSNELRFKGPFDDYVTVALTIRNPTEKRVAFKIKTTAPKRYCVKPNSGVLHSNQTIKVNVLLQPFNYDPNEKNKHKFMVQYLYLTEQEMQLDVNDILNLWKDLPANRLMDMKLKCIFEFTEEEQAKLQHLKQVTDGPSNISSQSATLPNASGQKSTSSTGSSKQTSSSSSSKQSSDVYSASGDTHANDFESMTSLNTNATNINPTPTTTASRSGASAAATAALKSSTTTSASGQSDSKNENTLNELKFYKQENEALKKEVNRLKEEELRLRKLALQAPSRPANAGNADASSLSDLLNNRLVLIIIILIAIIVYLLLFR